MTSGPVLPPSVDIVAEMELAATGQPTNSDTALIKVIVELVKSNLRQWDLEDATRDPGASDPQVANAKREIDRLNVARHRLVEQIDVAIDSMLDQPATATPATESPGMVLDRLSVLVIRRVRTTMASPREPELADRVRALQAQVDALSAALDCYMDELRAGRKRFLRYRSFKLYGPSITASGSEKE